MKGRPRVVFQRTLGGNWAIFRTKLGNYFQVWRELYAYYDADFNVIRILSEFSPREKFLSLAHEYVHYFLWQLPEYCVIKLDKWHDRLSEFVQHIPILSLPTALKHQENNLKLARRLSKPEVDKLSLSGNR